MKENTANTNKWAVVHFPNGMKDGKEIKIKVARKNLFDKDQVSAIMEATEEADEIDRVSDSGCACSKRSPKV